MTTSKDSRAAFIPIDDRDPASVRAVILARSSDLGAKADDMRAQVEQCRDFIDAMGWRLVADPYRFCESASGMRNVARPVLNEVLKLAIAGELDVIVCREMERVARTKGRRYQAVQTALDFGCEFRFANHPATCGKLPDDPAQRLYAEFAEFMAQAEAEKIAERLWPEKLRRLEDGLPHGGRGGPLYGYAPGERRMGKHGKPMGLLTWVINPDTAPVVRGMYDWVDSRDTTQIAVRGLAIDLNRRGIPSPTGVRWSSTTVHRVLANPKYCGQGRNHRFHLEHVAQQDATTREVRDTTVVHDRLRDPERWASETYPIPPDVIPPLVSVEQWQRVQDKLAAAASANRRRPRRTDAQALSTRLDGFYRCAACGRSLSRYWVKPRGTPRYRCIDGPHPSYVLHAHHADAFVLPLLAAVLTDPEHVLQLADAAQAQQADADPDAHLSAAALAAYQQQMAQIAAQQDDLLRALDALAHVPGMGAGMADIQAKLAQLDRDRAQADADARQTQPRHEHAVERAALLRRLFTHRGAIFNFARGGGLEDSDSDGDPYLDIGATMPLAHAALLLGISEDDLRATKIPVESSWLDEGASHTSREHSVKTEHVLRLLLHRLPRERLRALLRDLGVVVLVKRGRNRADYSALGPMPLRERITVEVLGQLHGYGVGDDDTNVTIFG